MQRFRLGCEHGDFLTEAVVSLADMQSDTAELARAVRQLIQHAVLIHAIDPDAPFTFHALDAGER